MSVGFLKEVRQVTLVLVVVWHSCDAFSKMDVTPACNTMEPGHGHERQSSPAPYRLEANPSGDGRSYDVTLRANQGTDFEGFLIQARNTSDQQVGAWESVSDLTRVIECTPGCAVQHSDENHIEIVMAKWYPMTHKGPVQFRATVVKGFDTFWMNVRSRAFNIF